MPVCRISTNFAPCLTIDYYYYDENCIRNLGMGLGRDSSNSPTPPASTPEATGSTPWNKPHGSRN